MNVSTMRLVDRILGIPVCWLLTRHRQLFEFALPKRSQDTTRILFVKLAEQGATVLAYPALKSAISTFGGENVYFLVFEENRFILDAMEVIPEQNVIVIPTENYSSFFYGTLTAIKRIRTLEVGAVIDFEFFARSSAALSYLSGASKRVGFHSFSGEASYRGDLMTHRLSFNPHLHTSQTYQMMVEALNVPGEQLPSFDLKVPPIDTLFPQFHPEDDEIEAVSDIIKKETGQETNPPLILLNANASDMLPLRRWSDQRYIELARSLLSKYSEIYIAFTGSPEEACAVEQLIRAVDSHRCFSMAGKTTLRQLLILYSLTEVLVTNDSGPAHFATLTPIDVVVLFGPETPALFAAQTPQTHVMWSGIVCSPCVNAYNDRRSACTNNICMQRITVDQVLEEVCRLYESRIKIKT